MARSFCGSSIFCPTLHGVVLKILSRRPFERRKSHVGRPLFATAAMGFEPSKIRRTARDPGRSKFGGCARLERVASASNTNEHWIGASDANCKGKQNEITPRSQ